MKKLFVTTALALVLAGSAYAQGHNHGSGGGNYGAGGGAAISGGANGGGGGGTAFSGNAHVGGGGQPMTSRGPSGSSSFSSNARTPSSSYNGRDTMRSQFSRTDQGSHGRTVYNQDRGNRTLYNRYNDQDRGRENLGRDRDDERFGRDRGRDLDLRNRGVVRGNFFEHGRHFGFRRFWRGEWVFLTDWDSCTAWAWVHVAPGVWAWRPVDVCVG